jgi:hypothetical protein
MALQQFDIHSLAHWSNSPVCLIVGKRGTGKSFLATDILHHLQLDNNEIIFSGKKETGLLGYNKYQPHLIQELLDHRQEVSGASVDDDEKSRVASNNIPTETAVVLDDCMRDTTWTRDVAIQNLFADKTRGLGVTCIMTMQYPMAMPRTLRDNVDYIFILSDPDIVSRRKLYEQYGAVVDDFELFCYMMDRCNGLGECLLVSNRATSDNIYHDVFRYTTDMDS